MPELPQKLTPMLEQYLGIKAEYPDALLMYRMGDFYELFFEDAATASRELQIALTSRGKDGGNAYPMCGVPWHAAQSYMAQLVDRGYSVAICDQVEDPRDAKGIVKRAVTCVLTPGTVLDDANLGGRSHNYLGAVCENASAGRYAFAWAEVSTGQWSGVEFRKEADLWQWVQKLAPRELLVPEGLSLPPRCLLEGIRLVRIPVQHFEPKRAAERVLTAQGVQEAAALGLEGKETLMRACGGLLAYLEQTQKRDPEHLMPFRPLNLGRRLLVDEITERNLEIFVRLNGHRGKGTLRHTLDMTMTPMGGRFLEDMLHHPWRELTPIRRIQEAVAYFHDNDEVRAATRAALDKVYDLERLSTRISLNRSSPKDFIALRESLGALPAVRCALIRPQEGRYLTEKEATGDTLPEPLYELLKVWDDLDDLAALLQSALVDDPPAVITDGGLFRQGFHAGLDALLDLVENGEQKLQRLLEEEQRKTGINRLKLGYNRVFGYYYEISRAAGSAPPPEHFIRRQTLVNAERFTTEELKHLEEELLSAADKRKSLEYQIFQDLRAHVAAQRERLVHMADLLAHLDYWQCLAEVGRRNGWTRPTLTEDTGLDIRGGRHPVVEAMVGSANFVPNDLHLDKQHRLCLLTGPNMAGKSTILRQVALICLLAQMGSLVPAEEATIGLVDRLFSRVGASDDLARGQSTFMVEMMETARILRQATRRSLVILDEIGRGTSTFDGMALAWAVVEDLAGRGGGELRTLFATHYHELTALEGRIPGVFTMNIAIREHNNDILFLHKLVPGPSDRSYGVEVARLAGVPVPVVQRARAILSALEKSRESGRKNLVAASLTLPGVDMAGPASGSADNHEAQDDRTKTAPPHPLLRLLGELSPEELSPLEALKLLMEWKQRWGQDEANGGGESA
ncbi:MAG: DNA mismatch repair protein MutS [Desulfovibrio sp.]|nr:DNA mismatch repair protein MutS [Desulfovibrio sp.]